MGRITIGENVSKPTRFRSSSPGLNEITKRTRAQKKKKSSLLSCLAIFFTSAPHFVFPHYLGAWNTLKRIKRNRVQTAAERILLRFRQDKNE